jgi:hypothetical protein
MFIRERILELDKEMKKIAKSLSILVEYQDILIEKYLKQESKALNLMIGNITYQYGNRNEKILLKILKEKTIKKKSRIYLKERNFALLKEELNKNGIKFVWDESKYRLISVDEFIEYEKKFLR